MLKTIVVGLFMVFIALTYQAILPPAPPKNSYYASSFMTSRIKLRDGRHLVYKEYGVPKEIAKYKAIFIHSLGGSKYEAGAITSRVLLEELGVYLVSFDRPGYGGSDPHPKRTMRSIALDIEELADQLGLGSKFYLIGYSVGGQLTWSCLKYIPERLEKVAMLTPAINYWWPGFPSNLTKEAFSQHLPWDQWAFGVAHHAPWLVYWWNTQTWFPRLSVIHGESNWSQQDLEILSKIDEEQLQMVYLFFLNNKLSASPHCYSYV
ncbi:hypothetical protein HAX54_003077 [Datura stramonium]|uniref:AB hydrolase-1 domain-containing protein n=1 Tax=Datura stramonium TaxID=4076 RepID=A0ABS8RTC3_DATST|nr:hypothetical protein [Datura stramonium]